MGVGTGVATGVGAGVGVDGLAQLLVLREGGAVMRRLKHSPHSRRRDQQQQDKGDELALGAQCHKHISQAKKQSQVSFHIRHLAILDFQGYPTSI